MLKTGFVLFVLVLVACGLARAQSVAQQRAERLGLGVNLSYLDNWWLGTKEKHFSDFAVAEEVAKREKMFADIAKAGFKTVRIPINFGAWASVKPPFKWENPDGMRFVDLFVEWALANGLNAIIDLHHVEFDGSIEGAASTERVVWLWKEIAGRYKNTNPNRIFFELRNEPHDIAPEVWREQAQAIMKAIRKVAPQHTFIVGFHDWNSRQALLDSKPFADGNIIYTFHYYDPFIFTHQGATWSAKGLPELTSVPFPAEDTEIKVPATAKGTWVEAQIKSYPTDSNPEKIFSDLKAAKEWSLQNNVPIFLGEFGSYSKYPPMVDRCRHAEAVYSSLGKLKIPNAWWEWNGGFSMFEKGTTRIANCMQKAIDSYKSQNAA